MADIDSPSHRRDGFSSTGADSHRIEMRKPAQSSNFGERIVDFENLFMKQEQALSSKQLELLLCSPREAPPHPQQMRRNSEEDLQVMKYCSLPMNHRARQEGWNISKADVEFQGVLQKGQGARKVAFKARWNRTDVVVVVHSDYQQSSEESEQRMQDLALLARNHRHPNLVLFLGACVDVSPALLVYERMGSTLYEVMRKRRIWKKTWVPPAELALRWSQHLALALAFLHGREPATVHGEITLFNLFISEDLQTLKVGNLGFTAASNESPTVRFERELSKEERRIEKDRDRFLSPETLKHVVCESKEGDVFSASAVTWYMCTGTLARSPQDIPADKGSFTSVAPTFHSSPVFKDLIRRGLAEEPWRRPSAQEMLQTVKMAASEQRTMRTQQRMCTLSASHPQRKSSLSAVVGASPQWVRNYLGEF